MKGKLMFILGSLFLLSTLLITSCGGGSAGGQKAEPQQAEGEKPVLKFAMSGQYRPFNYFNEDNELTGFDVEIGKALATKIGMTPEPIATPWQGIISGLKTRRYDAIIGSMTITAEREKEVDFTDPYYISGAQLFVASDSNLKSIADINNKVKIGVTISTVYEQKAREFSNQIKTYDSDVTALRDLAAGRTGAVITDRMVGVIAAKESGLAVKPVGELLFVENIGIAVQQGNDELLAKLNQALKDIHADGTYLKISQTYFGRDISQPE